MSSNELASLMTDERIDKIVLTRDDESGVIEVERSEFGDVVISLAPDNWKIEITRTEVY